MLRQQLSPLLPISKTRETRASNRNDQSSVNSLNEIVFFLCSSVGPYDIALMKLEEPFELNEYISTASLPYPDENHHGEAILTGWGSISRSRKPETPEVLQAATLPLIDYEECKQALDRRLKKEGRNPLHSTNVCTGPLDGSASACKVIFLVSCPSMRISMIKYTI